MSPAMTQSSNDFSESLVIYAWPHQLTKVTVHAVLHEFLPSWGCGQAVSTLSSLSLIRSGRARRVTQILREHVCLVT